MTRLLLALGMLFGVTEFILAETAFIDGIEYSLRDGTAIVCGVDDDIESLSNIPETINYDGNVYIVNEIGRFVSSNLRSITIPPSIKKVNSFHCERLSVVIIEDSDEEILFEYKDKYDGSFTYRCPIRRIYQGRNINYSWRPPFCRVSTIVDIEIGDKVTEINQGLYRVKSFYELEKIIIGPSVKNIGDVGDNIAYISSTFGAESYGTRGLPQIYMLAIKPPKIANGTFESSFFRYPLHVPSNCLDDYKYDGYWGSFKISDDIAIINRIEISDNELTLSEDETYTLSAAISPENAFYRKVRWVSSDQSVAQIDEFGHISALKSGITKITASTLDGSNLSATCTVTVRAKEIRVSSISLDSSSAQGIEGEQIQINATVIPEDATNKTLAWSSSDEHVAIVDENGLVSLIKEGTATISASATDGSDVSAECTVVVTEYSGIDAIHADRNTHVKILSLSGVLVYEGQYAEAKLVPDYYIVVCDGKSMKVKVE